MENNQENELTSLATMETESTNSSITTKANPKVEANWAKNFGGEFSDEGFGVDVDGAGNVYITGSFRDSVTFRDDLTVESKGSSDAFVVKLLETGEVVWVEQFGGSSADESNGIIVDEVGNSYVTGSFRNTAIFGTPTVSEEEDNSEESSVETVSEETEENVEETSLELKSEGNSDGFIAKLNQDGKVEWVEQFGGETSENGEGIALDGKGNTYITGNFKGEAEFGDFTLTGDDVGDGFVTKLGADGEIIWAREFGGDGFDQGYEIAVDETGNSYVTGSFEGDADFGDFQLSSENSSGVFVTKLDDAGNFEWAKDFNNTGDSEGYGITADEDGNSYVTGYFKGSITFGDTTLKSNGKSDGFIVKLDDSGNVEWANKFGGESDDEGFGITLDDSENIYLTGRFQDSVSFGDTILTSAGDSDAFIVKLDKMGSVKWAKSLGSESKDEGFDIAVKGDSETYVTGAFEDEAEIDDIQITSTAQKDAFVVKIAEEIPEISLEVTPNNITEYGDDGDNQLTYTFTRVGGNSDPLTVNFMVGGDAVFNQDYTQVGADSFSATEGMITFASEEKTATITIEAKDDSDVEPDESISLTLVAPKNHEEDTEEEEETETPEEVGELVQATRDDYNITTASPVTVTITSDDKSPDGDDSTDDDSNDDDSTDGDSTDGDSTDGDSNDDDSNIVDSGGGNSSADDSNIVDSGGGDSSGGTVNTKATKLSKNDKTFSLDGNSATIKFLVKRNQAGSVNEIALFKVDDESGTINGVSPDDANYTEVALQNSSTVFSVLPNPPQDFAANPSRIIEVDDTENFRFLMVEDGTLDGVRSGLVDSSQIRLSDSLEVSDIGDSNFDLNFFEDGSTEDGITVEMELDNQATKPVGTDLQSQQQGEVIDLRNVTTQQTATFTVNREAAFDNFVFFYEVVDADGGIDTNNDGVADVLPGDTDYITGALNNRIAGIDLAVENEGTLSVSAEFEAGSIFAPGMIINGTPDQLLDNDADNDPVVVFPYTDANPNQSDHVRMLGDNIFGFEDLLENADNDFNDIIVTIGLG